MSHDETIRALLQELPLLTAGEIVTALQQRHQLSLSTYQVYRACARLGLPRKASLGKRPHRTPTRKAKPAASNRGIAKQDEVTESAEAADVASGTIYDAELQTPDLVATFYEYVAAVLQQQPSAAPVVDELMECGAACIDPKPLKCMFIMRLHAPKPNANRGADSDTDSTDDEFPYDEYVRKCNA